MALRDHLGESFWCLGSAILVPRDHPGGPWEQQDGHKVARHRIFVDLGVISGFVSVSFWASKSGKNRLIFRLVFKSFFIDI